MDGRTTWLFINSFAPWLSALGTLSAATVALFLALRGSRLRLRCEFVFESTIAEEDLAIDIDDDNPDLGDDCVALSLVNDGPRDITIKAVLWRFGWISRCSAHVRAHDTATRLPAKLSDGDRASIRYDVLTFDREILRFDDAWLADRRRLRYRLERIARRCLPWTPATAVVISSTGKQFSCRVPRALVRAMPAWLPGWVEDGKTDSPHGPRETLG